MNRTTDGRFIEDRIRCDRDLLDRLICKYKDTNSLTWNDMAELLGVSAYTVRVGWTTNHNTIPISAFERLLKLNSLNQKDVEDQISIVSAFWGQRVVGGGSRPADISTPDIRSKEFAEFYGIMLGDGCVYSNGYSLCISGHSVLDKDYIINNVSKLVKENFNVNPKIYKSSTERSIRCVVNSKNLVEFMTSTGFPIGKKKNGAMQIHEQFLSDDSLLTSCIRGLFDTDGTLYRANSPILEISSYSPRLLESIHVALSRIGIKSTISTNRIIMSGNDRVVEFFRKVKPKNKKHLIKFESMIETGTIPRSTEVEKHLN